MSFYRNTLNNIQKPFVLLFKVVIQIKLPYLIRLINHNNITKIIHMDQFFTDNEHHEPDQPQYTPPLQQDNQIQPTTAPIQPQFSFEQPTFEFNAYASNQSPAFQQQENDFNDFEEDQTTKRIREEEERIQNILKEKSDREWEDKQKRKAEGSRLLEEYLNKKEQQKKERASENVRKESELKEDNAKLNQEAGWKKVISSINVRAGEHKGTKDIGRMRQAILHRREDDSR